MKKSETDNYEDNNTRFKKSNSYKILMEEPYRKQPLATQKGGRGGDMKMDLNQTCSKDESWMEMAKDHVQ
jgi:hypothetical protein